MDKYAWEMWLVYGNQHYFDQHDMQNLMHGTILTYNIYYLIDVHLKKNWNLNHSMIWSIIRQIQM